MGWEGLVLVCHNVRAGGLGWKLVLAFIFPAPKFYKRIFSIFPSTQIGEKPNGP